MPFELTILGCNSAVPVFDRFPSAQVLQVQSNLYLIDCGEGAQFQMSKFNVKRSRINQIFISHLHGDHINGLLGLLGSYALNGRTNSISIYAPAPIKEYVSSNIRLMGIRLTYPIECIEIDDQVHQKIFDDDVVEVYSVPLDHRTPTSGYIFKEKAIQRNIDPSAITKYSLSIDEIKTLKSEIDIHRTEGQVIEAKSCLFPAKRSRSYAYISDTAYKAEIAKWVKNIDLLYHETTYLHDLKALAEDRKHSTAHQAAVIALDANVGRLVTGHYSSRYKELDAFGAEASQVFKNTIIGKEGLKISVSNS